MNVETRNGTKRISVLQQGYTNQTSICIWVRYVYKHNIIKECPTFPANVLIYSEITYGPLVLGTFLFKKPLHKHPKHTTVRKLSISVTKAGRHLQCRM